MANHSHQTLALEAGKDVVTEKGALKKPADDIGHIHYAGDGAVVFSADEKCVVRGRLHALEIRSEPRGSVRGGDPRLMDRLATPHCAQELLHVGEGGLANDH